MTTTGSTFFNLDFTEIAEEAWERAGREMRSGYDLRTARRSMNLMTIEWQNRGINMWTIEEGTIPLVPGQNTYALPNDTIDLLEHVIRTGGNTASTQADLTITRISVSTYATIPNKLAPGRPIQIWVQRMSGETAPVGTTLVGTITSTATTITVADASNLAGTLSLHQVRRRDHQLRVHHREYSEQLFPWSTKHHSSWAHYGRNCLQP